MKKKIYILSILIIVIAIATVLFMRWNNQESKGVESTATEEEIDKEFSNTEITEADAMDDDYGTETTEKDAELTQRKMIPISCMYEEGEEVELTWDEIEEEIEKGNYNKEIVNIDRIQKIYI